MGKSFTPEEVQYIREHADDQTAKQIAKTLKRPLVSIYDWTRRNNVELTCRNYPARTDIDIWKEDEKLIVEAGSKANLSAEQIAVRLPGRSPASVQVKASECGWSLAVKKPVTIPDTGRMAFRLAPEEIPVYRPMVEYSALRFNLDTLTKVQKAGIRALYEQALLDENGS